MKILGKQEEYWFIAYILGKFQYRTERKKEVEKQGAGESILKLQGLQGLR